MASCSPTALRMNRAACRMLKCLPFGNQLLDAYESWLMDAYLISFPKCGRMWLVVMIGKLLQTHFHLPDTIDITDIERFPTYSKKVLRIRPTHAGSHPVYSSPDQVKYIPRKYRANKVIFLVRDPRDSFVSQFFRNKQQKLTDKNIQDWWLEHPDAFRTSMMFYKAWAPLIRSNQKRMLLVRYEDLHTEPEKQLRRVVDFLGITNVTDLEIQNAVSFSSLHNMKKLEQQGCFDRIKKSNSYNPYTHVRKGKCGEYAEVLPSDIVAECNRLMREMLPAIYGYEPSMDDNDL